ncbi:sigma-70 family RNA polymerase sigma factor [Niveispirillum sp. SYP-B3756]|uniref:sigma-70 family RNA polymerase sigma factor n=1 Tax=Niveispirillum sp. SYP-B3756 TaxID=2662178 RepID=UPI00156711CA|nr:sigma-70 family RNA polymerase sigma factor [Niveispirillum sp. SYP-B3756]
MRASNVSREAMEDADLAALLVAAQEGDRRAYAAFLNGVLPLLRGMGRGKLASAADMDDFVQDCLLSLHQARATYQPGRPVLPWLQAIARNRLSDALRRTYRRRDVEAQGHDSELLENVPQPAAEEVEGRELGPLLAQLPDRQRAALDMLKVRGMSLRDASAESGISVGALKVAVHRGIASLRQMLGRENEHD